MQTFLEDRGKGKTTLIMTKFLKDKKSMLIVISLSEKLRLSQFFKPGMAEEDEKRIFTFDQYQKGYHRGLGLEKVYIDNADMILQGLFGEPIELITISK